MDQIAVASLLDRAPATDIDAAPLRILYHHRLGSKDGQYVPVAAIATALGEQRHDVRIVGPGAWSGVASAVRRVMWRP